MSGKYLAAFSIILTHILNPDPSPAHGGHQMTKGNRYLRPGGQFLAHTREIGGIPSLPSIMTQKYDN